MNAPTIHVGDENQPVKTILIVHHDAPVAAKAPTSSAWWTVKQVATHLGVERSKVSRLISGGILAHRRIGAKLQVHIDEVTRYEASLPTEAVGGSGGDVADIQRAARQAMRLVPSSSGGKR